MRRSPARVRDQEIDTRKAQTMIITPAYAQASGGGGGDFFLSLVPILLMFVIFYFLLFRPQQKRMQEHRDMVSNVKKGDRIVTAGGIVGRVTRARAEDAEIEVEIAENTRIKLVRHTIVEVRTKEAGAEAS